MTLFAILVIAKIISGLIFQVWIFSQDRNLW